MKIASLASIVTLLLAGCVQRIALNSMGEIIDNGFTVLNEEQDLDIADKAIASDLKLLESVMKSDPENEHLLLLASMGYASYALGFVEDSSSERAKLFYLRARDYGMRILSKNPAFAGARDKGLAEFKSALTSFTKDDIPAVFWTALGWGSSIALSLTDPAAIVDLPKVESMMNFVVRENPSYFYGGAHFFLGTLYGSRPKMLGGDLDTARKHFQECLAINKGKFLLTYVYEARSVAVQTQDRVLFEQLLTTVDTTSLEILPEARLSNAIAKKKARTLRGRIDELF